MLSGRKMKNWMVDELTYATCFLYATNIALINFFKMVWFNLSDSSKKMSDFFGWTKN